MNVQNFECVVLADEPKHGFNSDIYCLFVRTEGNDLDSIL